MTLSNIAPFINLAYFGSACLMGEENLISAIVRSRRQPEHLEWTQVAEMEMEQSGKGHGLKRIYKILS